MRCPTFCTLAKRPPIRRELERNKAIEEGRGLGKSRAAKGWAGGGEPRGARRTDQRSKGAIGRERAEEGKNVRRYIL